MSNSLADLTLFALSTKFEDVIQKQVSYELHTKCARAVVLGSDIFYLPNSSFLPRLPSNDGHPFRCDPNTQDVEEIQQPLWYIHEMAYLPFVPKEPSFHIVPFDKLYSNPLTIRNIKRQHRKHMDSPDIIHWKTIEKQMEGVFFTLHSKYSIPEMKYTVSTTLVCNTEYESTRQYITAERRCRKWFVMWMGLLSFAIAVGQTWDGEDSRTPLPQWTHSLLRFHDEHIVAGIRQELALFSDHSPKAGVF